jgi:hypothetical protein
MANRCQVLSAVGGPSTYYHQAETTRLASESAIRMQKQGQTVNGYASTQVQSHGCTG